MMKRREFITLLGGAAAAWPLAARAQQSAMPVIGFLSSESPDVTASRMRAFRQGLSEAGYVEDRNVAAARMLGLTTERLSANDDREIERAFNKLANARPDALLVGPGPLFDSQRYLVVALAAKIAIPTGHETRATAVAGGLMSYGANVGDGYRQAGIYVGRVLNGEKPANLPVLQSTKFEFIINLKTTKALGLTVPDKLLALADEVIE